MSTPSSKHSDDAPSAAARAALIDAARALREGRLDEADSLARLAERIAKTAAALTALDQQNGVTEEDDDPRTLDEIREELKQRIERIAAVANQDES